MPSPNPPIHTQSQSPLFLLPPEIRLHIFSFALSSSPDATRLYSPDTYYSRPGYTAPQLIHTALLRTCKRIYAEARHFPFLHSKHTFFLCSHARAPSLPSRLRDCLAHKHAEYGSLETPHIQFFAQLYVLEQSAEFQIALDTPHLDPKTVTLTIRHTDFWYWEDWENLHIDAGWVNEVRFPNSVLEFAIEFETIDKRASDVDYLAAEAVDKWFFLRKDGRVLIAERSDTRTSAWTGSSVLHDMRWVRDEARPGELDYHVVTVRWKLVPADHAHALRLDLDTPRPKLIVPAAVAKELHLFGGFKAVRVRDLQQVNATKETPVNEVFQALHRFARETRRGVRQNRGIRT